jgi:hypothetical protein
VLYGSGDEIAEIRRLDLETVSAQIVHGIILYVSLQITRFGLSN